MKLAYTGRGAIGVGIARKIVNGVAAPGTDHAVRRLGGECTII